MLKFFLMVLPSDMIITDLAPVFLMSSSSLEILIGAGVGLVGVGSGLAGAGLAGAGLA
jgi:hypothetical protein